MHGVEIPAHLATQATFDAGGTIGGTRAATGGSGRQVHPAAAAGAQIGGQSRDLCCMATARIRRDLGQARTQARPGTGGGTLHALAECLQIDSKQSVCTLSECVAASAFAAARHDDIVQARTEQFDGRTNGERPRGGTDVVRTTGSERRRRIAGRLGGFLCNRVLFLLDLAFLVQNETLGRRRQHSTTGLGEVLQAADDLLHLRPVGRGPRAVQGRGAVGCVARPCAGRREGNQRHEHEQR